MFGGGGVAETATYLFTSLIPFYLTKTPILLTERDTDLKNDISAASLLVRIAHMKQSR